MEHKEVNLVQSLLRTAAAGGGGGAVLLLGSILLDLDELKRDVHLIQMDLRVYESTLNDVKSRTNAFLTRGRGRAERRDLDGDAGIH